MRHLDAQSKLLSLHYSGQYEDQLQTRLSIPDPFVTRTTTSGLDEVSTELHDRDGWRVTRVSELARLDGDHKRMGPATYTPIMEAIEQRHHVYNT